MRTWLAVCTFFWAAPAAIAASDDSYVVNILNGEGGPYTTSYILSVKSALDAFANMG